MSKKIGSDIKKGVIWNFLEQVVFRLIQFLIQLILTRLLMPEDYGLVAISLVFVNITYVFVSTGLGSALIYKKNASSLDFSSTCWISLIVSAILYFLLFICAPFIADFYDDTRITSIIRVLSVSLIFGSFNSIQLSVIQKNMQFKKSFFGNSVAVIFSSLLAVLFAYLGYGIWALVIQFLASRIFLTISLYILNKWLPKFEFSWVSIRYSFSYGWKLMATSILSALSGDIYSLVIGKHFSKTQLGVYDIGIKIPSNLGNMVATTIGNVLFPAFSKSQDDLLLIKGYIRKSNRLTTFLLFPMLYMIAGMADPLVRFIFTDKWAEAVPFLQIACVMYSFNSIHLANLQVTKAVGRPELGLYMEVVKKTLDIVLLLITIHFGIHFVALGLTISSICALWINIEPLRPYIHYSTLNQIRDILPTFFISLISGFIMYFSLNYLHGPLFLIIVIDSFIGIIVYLIFTLLFNRVLLKEFVGYIYQLKNR